MSSGMRVRILLGIRTEESEMRIWLIVLTLLLCRSGVICGQTSLTLTVHLIDAGGSPIPDAELTATPTRLWGPIAPESPITLHSDHRGEARFSLSPGTYRIIVTKQRFQQLVMPNFEMGHDDQQLALDLAPGATICEPCFVTQPPPPLELLESPPLTLLIEQRPPIAPLILQTRSTTKGMFRGHRA